MIPKPVPRMPVSFVQALSPPSPFCIYSSYLYCLFKVYALLCCITLARRSKTLCLFADSDSLPLVGKEQQMKINASELWMNQQLEQQSRDNIEADSLSGFEVV